MLAGMTAHKLHEIRHDLKGNSQYFMILRNSSSIDNSGKNNSNRDSKRKNSAKDSDSNDNSMVFVNAITGDGINSIPSNKYDSSCHTPSHTPPTSKITTTNSTNSTNSNNISNRSHDSITRSMIIYGDSCLTLDLRLMEGGIVRPQLRMAFYSPELRDEWVDAFRMHIQLANKLYLSKASSV